VIQTLAIAVMNAAAPGAGLEARIAAELSGADAVFGVAAVHLGTGEGVFVNADERFPTASTIKVAVMVEAFHQIAEGRLRHDTPITMRAEDRVGGSGVLHGMHPGLALTVDDALHLMMAVSDNTATNLLVDRLGTANIDRRLESHGLRQTKIFRATFRDGRPDVFPELEKEFGLGMATPREMALLLAKIARGEVVDRAAGDAMIGLMERQAFPTHLPRRLPEGDDVRIAHKPGWDAEKIADAAGVKRHVRADAGIVRTPKGTYVVALFARRIADRTWGPDNEAVLRLARVSRLVYDHFTR
jgi:beta-lactamase class A